MATCSKDDDCIAGKGHPGRCRFPSWTKDALAAAWDEGYARGVRDEVGDLERADNPYR